MTACDMRRTVCLSVFGSRGAGAVIEALPDPVCRCDSIFMWALSLGSYLPRAAASAQAALGAFMSQARSSNHMPRLTNLSSVVAANRTPTASAANARARERPSMSACRCLAAWLCTGSGAVAIDGPPSPAALVMVFGSGVQPFVDGQCEQVVRAVFVREHPEPGEGEDGRIVDIVVGSGWDDIVRVDRGSLSHS